MILESAITGPHRGTTELETMPIDACWFFYMLILLIATPAPGFTECMPLVKFNSSTASLVIEAITLVPFTFNGPGRWSGPSLHQRPFP
jgi:hypothetical protein